MQMSHQRSGSNAASGGVGQGAREGQDEKRDRKAKKEVRGNMGRACRGGQKGVASREEGWRHKQKHWNESKF